MWGDELREKEMPNADDTYYYNITSDNSELHQKEDWYYESAVDMKRPGQVIFEDNQIGVFLFDDGKRIEIEDKNYDVNIETLEITL